MDRVRRFGGLVCAASIFLWSGQFLPAQDADRPSQPAASQASDEETKERITAERFLELLKKRPRLGTALDRVYGYHVGRGSLESFAEALAREAEAGKDGNTWLILGMVQMRRGQDAQAAQALDKAEALLPDEALASYYLGKTLVVLGEVDKAAAAMRRAIDRKPARPDLLAIFQDLGRVYQRTGRNAEALDVWRQLEAQFPGDLQVREQIAGILAEEGATQAALDRYLALAAATKDKFRQVELSMRAAQLKAQLGKTEEAIRQLEAQLAVVNPDSWLHRDVRRRIEEIFWSSGDVDGLVKYYTAWVGKHPDDVDAMMRAARALSAQRRLPEAEKWFRDAIAKGPSLAEPRLALVEALAGDDRHAEAAAEMGRLVEQVPDNPDYIVRWGELVFADTQRSEESRRREAADIWRRLLAKRGDDPVTVARVADLLRSSGASDAAIGEYRKAIELAPNEPQYREYLGEYLHQLGRKDEALAAWRELAAGERETRDNLVRLSEVLSTFQFPDEALATIAKACQMKPTFGHRARYAELLREAGKYDEALAELDRAEPMAEDPELRELVIEERIKNYQASGKLAERTEQTAADVAGAGAKDPMKWRLLALLRDADRKFQLACDAIDKATELAPGDVSIWETAATLQERAGRFGDAIASYRKLATIDRRFSSNYLTQIASLEMRLGNVENALAAGEELLASAPGNSEHFRFYADLCFQTGNSDRGFEVLRRNARANPNDSEALVYLARMLGEEFQTDEAIELYWRAFDLAKDVDGQIAVIAPLAELYLRTNRFDTLVERLETIGREDNKPRDGLLWVAAAQQAAGDLGSAKQTLERLVREDSRDVKLLAQLVTLAKAEFDFETAAEYQKRLVAAAPSPEAEYLLGTLLLELGEINEAEALWLKLSQRSNDPQALTASIYTLLNKEEFETAAKVIEKALARQPEDWELYAAAMMAYVKLGRKEDARRTADRVLGMSVDPAQPTKKMLETIKKQTGRRNNANAYDPSVYFGQPINLLQAGQRIKQIVDGSARAYNPYGSTAYAPNCFQDVQALAWCMPLIATEKGFDPAKFVKDYAEQAVQNRDVDQLWRAILYLTWQMPNVQYQDGSDELYEKCLEALIEKEDPYAALNRMTKMMNSRRVRAGNDLAKIEPLNKEEIEKLKRYASLAARGNARNIDYYELLVAVELSRAGEEDLAEEIIDRFVAKGKSSPNASYSTLQAMSILVSENYNQKPSPRAVAKALELLKATLADLKLTVGGMGSNYGQMIGSLLGQLVKQDRLDDALAALDDVLKWQAAQAALLRPSQRERMQSTSTPLSFYRVVGGRGVQHSVTFPPVSAYLGAEAILATNGIFEACKEDEPKLAKLKEALAARALEPGDNPQLRAARLLAYAGVAYWSGEQEKADELLAGADPLQMDPQFIGLARSRLLYEAGKMPAALAVVEKLRPTNQQMLVDRELAILQLVLQLGDLDRARASAGKLFALRLESHTEFKLAELMYQLGMKELGDRMMGRIRRRAGGRQETLVLVMNRYAESGDKASAAEIARQVIRRTAPRGVQNYITAENQQHEQALRVLHQAGQLDELIKQYEGLVERSPKSTKLVDKLAAFYEAAGRRDDAQKLRLKAAEDSPDDPNSLLAAGQQLTRLKKYSEAVDKYIAAVVKSPEILDRSYYDMQSAFREAKAWSRLSDAILKEGIGKFPQSYRLGELCNELGREKNFEALNRLLIAALSDLNWQQLSQIMYSLASLNVKPSAELVKLVGDKLTAPDAQFESLSNSAFVWSRSTDGRTSGFTDGIAKIVVSDDALRDLVLVALNKRLEKSPHELFPRVLASLIYAHTRQFDELEKTIRPVMDKKNKVPADGQALWCVASMLAHTAKNPGLACKVLESADPQVFREQGGSGFQWTAMALMAFAYEKAGRSADAHRILVDEMRNAAVDESQNQWNPGYGESQFMESLASLSERFLKMGYPAEAFIAWRKAFADPSMIDKALRWGGNLSDRRDTLKKQITAKRNADSTLKIIQATLAAPGGSDPAAQAAVFLTEPVIERNSLIDTRVTMPLDQFISEIGEQAELRASVAKLLAENPPAAAGGVTLKTLVTRLLLSDAARDEQQAQAAAAAIADWVRTHEAPPVPVETPVRPEASPSAQKPSPQNPAPQDPAKPPPKKLPDELLLGMAAVRMPAQIDTADVVRMLERAIVAAKASRETALVGSLQCQIAQRVAPQDPERARAMLRATLDELLPPESTQASAAGAKEGK